MLPQTPIQWIGFVGWLVVEYFLGKRDSGTGSSTLEVAKLLLQKLLTKGQ